MVTSENRICMQMRTQIYVYTSTQIHICAYINTCTLTDLPEYMHPIHLLVHVQIHVHLVHLQSDVEDLLQNPVSCICFHPLINISTIYDAGCVLWVAAEVP
jgi:hypothetical protein